MLRKFISNHFVLCLWKPREVISFFVLLLFEFGI
jgi:hypothetical protein